MTDTSPRSSETTLGGRLIKALDAASRAVVKGVSGLVEGALPAPQPVPIRVSRGRRIQG